MAKLLLGKPVREKIAFDLKVKISTLSKVPTLAIVQVGDREESTIYIKNKIKFSEEVGVNIIHKKFPDTVSQVELEQDIKSINLDSNVDAMIVQLPLPESSDKERILKLIGPKKDVDGLGLNSKVMPATARAVMSLLDFYNIDILNKKVTVIGRSKLVGKPTAEVLKANGALVEVCHRETPNIAEVCRGSEILISAAGQAGLVTKEFVNKDQVVIDVGINRNSEGKLSGDVAFEEVEPIVKAITPVPGGVGPLTVACLYLNLLDLIS